MVGKSGQIPILLTPPPKQVHLHACRTDVPRARGRVHFFFGQRTVGPQNPTVFIFINFLSAKLFAVLFRPAGGDLL